MSNEFEKQKINAINLILDKYSRGDILKAVRAIQPPAPPKCSTCKIITCAYLDEAISCEPEKNWSEDTFGCMSHSDYEQTGSEQQEVKE